MKKTSKNRGGRPREERTLDEYMEIRMEAAEKQAFKQAADVDGMTLSVWVRHHLRQIAKQRLEEAGRVVPFLPTNQRRS